MHDANGAKATEIARNIYWVGTRLPDDPFQCHPYLIVNGDESILIDPGSMLEFDEVAEKIRSVVDPSAIRYVVLHHQDPDLAACLPQMERLIGRDDLQLVTHSRMTVLIKHYGVRSSYYEIDRHDFRLETKTGLTLEFLTTPYCHSPGAFVSFEPRSGVLFSGDIFGGLEESWKLFADENYFEEVREFHSSYMPSRDILNYALRKIEALDISLIAPQHGSIVRRDLIPDLIAKMKALECGLYIEKHYHEELTETIDRLKRQEQELNAYKKRLEEKVEAQTRSLVEANRKLEKERERLRRFNRSISQLHSVDISHLAQSSTRHLLEIVDAQMVLFFAMREEGLELIAKSAIDDRLWCDNRFLPSGRGLVRQAYERGEAIDVELDDRTALRVDLGTHEAPLRYQRALPLRFQERKLGVLLIASFAPLAPFEEYMDGYVSTLVQSLNNAYTFVEIQKQSLELRRINNELEASNRLKSEFLANVSHELRTPLNSIIGFSNILMKNRQGNLSDKQLQQIEKIQRNGIHLLDLINAILDLSKIEAGKMEVEWQRVDAVACMKELVAMLTPQAMEGAKRLVFENATGEEALWMTTDEQKCQQILINLVSNAIKFVEEGKGEVRVRLEREGDGLSVSVIDNGIGIEEEKLAVIFEAFRQADGSTTRQYGGTGLGLTISKNLAHLLGGDIAVRSRPGEGSTFTLRLPINGKKSDVKKRIGISLQPQIESFGSLEKVLIIDDNADTVELLEEYFKEMGCKTVGTVDPKEGLRLAETLRPSLITLDIMMPEMNGWEVLGELKANPKTENIPVLLISNLSEKRRALNLGAIDTLVKPFSKEELEKLVERYFSLERPVRNVLVVDDEKDMRDLIAEYIDPHVERIVEASDGREALQLLAQGFEPDLVYLDLMMPRMGGFEFLERCKLDGYLRDAKLIVITAKELTPEERSALVANHAVVLPKGSGLESIVRELKRSSHVHL